METYEKRYKEAQKWIESIYTELSHERQMEAEAFFPEFKESEDDKVRKELFAVINDLVLPDEQLARFNTWLEKQGEKSTIIDIDKMVKEYSQTKDGDFGFPVNCMIRAYRQGINDALRLSLNLEKQGEQVLANSAKTCKNEPKFKKGDWVILDNNHNSLYQIEKIENYQYFLRHYLGGAMALNFSVENNLRLWTINDAKDGDVLYSLDSKQPFIFKHRKPHEQAAVYCGVNIYGKFFVENTNDCIVTADKYIPADKFQRDLLFEKMNVAGYKWDADKKELRKIEQKSVDENNGNIGKTSSNWSEVDNVRLNDAIQMVESNGTWIRSDDAVKDVSDWLKSLLTKTKGGNDED